MAHKPKSSAASSPERIMQIANAFHQSCLLFAALDLDLFTKLAQLEAADLKSLAEQCGMSERGARLLLDGCVAIGLLEKSAANLYRNTIEASAFLVQGRPGYLGGAIKYNRDVYPAWGQLSQLARTGKPVERPEIHLGEDSRRTENFVRAMHGRALAIGRAVVPELALTERKRVLDIGAGPGTYSILLAQQWPQLQFMTIDLPAVTAISRKLIAEAGLSSRINSIAGDYHTTPFPDNFDTALLFGMLHQEPPTAIIDLLTRTFAALDPGGIVYILDLMTDDSRCHPQFSAMFAINMALTSEHGWVFSDRELADWMRTAGFIDFQCRPLAPPMPHWLASGIKPG